MPRPTTRGPRIRPLPLLAISVSLAATATACGGSDTASQTKATASASTSPTGVITKAAADKVVDHYQAANNRANATRNAGLLGTVEAGQAYAQDKGTYRQLPTWSKKDQKRYASPFSYDNRKYLIPAAGTWFAMMATSSDSKDRGLFVYDKADGGQYKMSAAIWLDKKTASPKFALDPHGLAEAVDPATQVGALKPTQLRTAYEDLWLTGGTEEGDKLTPNALTKKVVKEYWDYREHGVAPDPDTGEKIADSYFVAAHPVSTAVYALRLANGGVLALTGAAHTQHTVVKAEFTDGELYPGTSSVALGAEKGRKGDNIVAVSDTYQGEILAELTPRTATVVGTDWEMVASKSTKRSGVYHAPKPMGSRA